MPDFMRASDCLITKAGPGTISEAFIAGLPMILYSYMPGQEDGNIDYVVNEGAGVWAPRPELVVSALRRWLNDPKSITDCHKCMSQACQTGGCASDCAYHCSKDRSELGIILLTSGGGKSTISLCQFLMKTHLSTSAEVRIKPAALVCAWVHCSIATN